VEGGPLMDRELVALVVFGLAIVATCVALWRVERRLARPLTDIEIARGKRKRLDIAKAHTRHARKR
jgi:hypothetical protein